MRQVFIRGIISLVWFAVAIINGISGKLENAALSVLVGCVILYSAYTAWKKRR
ncbi:MAG: hypothetical protein HFI81_05735 [Eubacterium sp.]|jgi:hypothetical protein|nr:hypothetical protein [Eubacterium sp.]